MADAIRWKRAPGTRLDLKDARRLGTCCAELATSRGAQVVLRSDRATSPTHAAALAREATFWGKAAARDAHILPLLDWGALPAGGVCFLSPLVERLQHVDEARALSISRNAAATVARTRSVHGNLSVETVFCTEDGIPVVGGWGATRLRNVEDGATEQDDVQALAKVLYFLLSGREYAGGKLRLDKAAVSSNTRRLLKRVLDGDKDISLLEYRYDLGAAAGDLPVCTRALPPSEPKRRKDTLLKADLNSVNGSISRREAELRGTAPTQPPVVPVRQNSSTDGVLKRDDGVSAAEMPVAPTVTLAAVVSQQPRVTPSTLQGSVDDVVSSLVEPELDAMDVDQLQSLVHECNKRPAAVDEMFNLLFKRPVGKNPIVAFKGLILLHTLLREGPAEATTLAVTHDGFLGWVEASWSRERIQSRPPQKAHRLSHCFAVGELGWYASFLRRRAAFFLAYTAMFSPRWTVRSGALRLTGNNNRALRAALSVLEGAVGVLKRAANCSDPAELVKKGAILPLATDIAYAYRACCWLYATAPSSLKSGMEDDLDAAHHATRSVFRAISGNPPVASSLPPHIVLQLDEAPPRNIEGNKVMAAMQGLSASPSTKSNGQKKKKAKRRESDATPERLKVQPPIVHEIDNEGDDTVEPSDGEGSNQSPGESELMEKSKDKDRSKKKNKKKMAEGEPITTDVGDAYESPVGQRVPAQPPVGDAVRRGPASNRDGKAQVDNGGYEGSVSGDIDEHDRVENEEANGEVERRRNGGKGKEKAKKRNSGRKAESRRSVGNRSDGSSTDSDLDDSSDDSSDRDATESRPRISASTKKVSRRHRSEKDIPFDKDPPKRRHAVTSKKSGNGQTANATVASTEDRQGSKEALAAAASGKKTPQINPSFEVAPYEVQFGPQIGSGGFGIVYKAKFRGLTVAVKKIHAHALSNVASVAEFQSEVAVLCTLKHPNILAFMGACTKPPNLMIITEFMARGTLFDVLHQSQLRITWPMRRRFALDTCRGMRYLHDSKLLHRDLKSSNLMLDKDFNCKVGDFGLTRTSSGTSAVQMTGQCGTFQYMAVEVLANKPYSEKADVFSFGILLWEMVARKLPYFGMQPMQVGIAVVQQGLRPTIPPKTPAPLSKLMRSCWDNDPNRRPSFAQLVQMLEAMPE